jgi:hypothetical protein
MNYLPEDIENIILNYKNDIETYENNIKKYKKCLNDISNMNYKINKTTSGNITSERLIKSRNSYYMFSKSTQQLFCWNSFSTI